MKKRDAITGFGMGFGAYMLAAYLEPELRQYPLTSQLGEKVLEPYILGPMRKRNR